MRTRRAIGFYLRRESDRTWGKVVLLICVVVIVLMYGCAHVPLPEGAGHVLYEWARCSGDAGINERECG